MAAAQLQLSESPVSLRAERAALERAVAGRYKVLRLVSRGGMGAVYLGFERGLERNVAIKMLRGGSDEDSRGRFRREARVMAQLAHPGIVPVHGWGESDGLCWYAMPYLEGGTLEAGLSGRERRGIEKVRAILLQLTEALEFAHGRGVIHRDIKAENVVFDSAGRALLYDFGVATVTTSEHSRAEANRGMGTPHYMAPELLLGALDADHRGDIYALGVLGFRMLTGRFPFDGSSAEIAAQKVSRAADPVSAWRAGVPPALADAIDRSLAREPRDRWPDASSLAAALRREAPAKRFSLGRFKLLML